MKKTVVHYWIEFKIAEGKSKAEAMRELNKALSTRYIQSRLYDWLNGPRSPERATRIYMLTECLPHILAENGFSEFAGKLTKKQCRALAEALA